MNLIEGIQKEQARVREVLKQYESIPQGAFGAVMLKQALKNSEKAIAEGDTIKMLSCYQELKDCE